MYNVCIIYIFLLGNNIKSCFSFAFLWFLKNVSTLLLILESYRYHYDKSGIRFVGLTSCLLQARTTLTVKILNLEHSISE